MFEKITRKNFVSLMESGTNCQMYWHYGTEPDVLRFDGMDWAGHDIDRRVIQSRPTFLEFDDESRLYFEGCHYEYDGHQSVVVTKGLITMVYAIKEG